MYNCKARRPLSSLPPTQVSLQGAVSCCTTASTQVCLSMYLLQCKGRCLPSSDLSDWEPLPVNAANRYWLKLAVPERPEEESVTKANPTLHAGPGHHRTHTLSRGGGAGKECPWINESNCIVTRLVSTVNNSLGHSRSRRSETLPACRSWVASVLLAG